MSFWTGISAASFVEHARLNGCSTPITMITEDRLPPYDRVLLSKVVDVDVAHRLVYLSSGESMKYSKLVLAIGCAARKLSIPGGNLRNVYTLRVVDEANAIAEASIGKHVVCIGGSFIGMEIASSLVLTAASVTVRFEAKGIQVIVNDSVEQLEGDVAVSSVILKSGIALRADVVVVGIGVEPPTEWLKNTSVEMDERGFIKVDRLFRTTADWVYAIGDVVSAPLPLWDIDSINIQHFQTAQTHGQLLGYSIVGRPFPHPVVPFFWTLLFFEFGVKFAGVSNAVHFAVISKTDILDEQSRDVTLFSIDAKADVQGDFALLRRLERSS
uniref:Pyr_redox_2 domain-containing protein n=1 Tax=Angiostrongylus cantonensis TaxID=6313 RepID=A0A158P9L0_ANGCA